MKYSLKTKIELLIAFLILAAIPAVIIYNNNVNRIYLYEANNRYTHEPAEIGSDDSYNVGDTVIVDETNFVDMKDITGTQYIITKDNGSIYKK